MNEIQCWVVLDKNNEIAGFDDEGIYTDLDEAKESCKRLNRAAGGNYHTEIIKLAPYQVKSACLRYNT